MQPGDEWSLWLYKLCVSLRWSFSVFPTSHQTRVAVAVSGNMYHGPGSAAGRFPHDRSVLITRTKEMRSYFIFEIQARLQIYMWNLLLQATENLTLTVLISTHQRRLSACTTSTEVQPEEISVRNVSETWWETLWFRDWNWSSVSDKPQIQQLGGNCSSQVNENVELLHFTSCKKQMLGIVSQEITQIKYRLVWLPLPCVYID